jgi:hypothetical protein
MSDTFADLLQSWKGNQVTVVNPESYTSTALREGLGFEAYTATLSEVTASHVMLTYSAQRKGKTADVQQWIPIPVIKRLTIMGDEKFIHL